MLDSDIARLYNMETRRINEQVKRNPIKFPERYVFQLSDEEVKNLKSQNATSNSTSNLKSHKATSRWGGTRKLPYAFTERGASIKDLGKRWFGVNLITEHTADELISRL